MLYPLKSNSRGMNNKYIKYIVSKKKKIQERWLSSEKMVIINELIILVM